MVISGFANNKKRYLFFWGLCTFFSLCISLAGCGWNPFGPGTGSPFQSSPETVEENETPQKEVSLFFNRGSSGELGDVVRSLPEDFQRQPIQYAVSELLKGPTETEKKAGFYTEIPGGTQLLGVSRHGGTITLDMSKKFASGGGSNSMIQRVEELKRTVYALDKKHQLRVSIEGKPLDVLGGEGLEVNDSLKRQLN